MADKKSIRVAIGRPNEQGAQLFEVDQFGVEDALYFARFIRHALEIAPPLHLEEEDGIRVRPEIYPILMYAAFRAHLLTGLYFEVSLRNLISSIIENWTPEFSAMLLEVFPEFPERVLEPLETVSEQ